MAYITVKNLSFTYPKCDKKALDNINMEIAQGQFILICGDSGCSKTTLLRHFKSVLTPPGKRDGDVLLDGKRLSDIGEKEQARKIGFVFQSPDDQIVTDKVWHELAFSLESLNERNDIIALKCAEAASYFDLSDKYRSSVETLSGGQKQLLNLASVMTVMPDILILDEPTSQLDPIAADNFLTQIKKLNDEFGITVIMSEHNCERVFPMADKVALMKNGSLVSFAPPEQTAAKYSDKNSDFFLSLPAPARIAVNAFLSGKTPLSVKEGRQTLALNNIKPSKQCDNLDDTDKKDKKNKILEIKDVFFRYSRSSPDVLSGLTLDINSGEILCVLGANGAGKSTLLSIMSGMSAPYSGKIKSGKKTLTGRELRTKTCVLPQDVSVLFVKDTLGDELNEVIKKNGEKVDTSDIRKTAEYFGLDSLFASHPFDLSGGEQEKSAIAKVLLTDADIFLFDEPTKGMDPAFKIKFGNILKELKNKNKTFIIISHDMEFAAEFADRCVYLFDGKIVGDDEPRRFFAGNSFYTTAANRTVRALFPDCVTAKEAWELCLKQKEK